ncbi:hypothetical protein PPSIR1_30070 [Plesiocystis pacifica SIR-1]|uniref:Uncharacterized protein n=1 Tax=Plesiocystis pacifica SIR-1 TaxID=391625 RepID=A6FYZ3_9BACT|nr:hypothetical protein [Plesiocystis pacifica]EDM81148.1 hypothetical protein PPSIR1_30070 [Plesiocystis pacifica SIR-1]
MARVDRICLLLGLALSTLAGLWHFAIPYQYRWHDHLTHVPRPITVSVDWINFFFSLLLAGLSLLVIRHRDRLEHDQVARELLALLVLTWTARVVLTVAHPWAYDLMFAAQLSSFLIVWALLALPFLRLYRRTPTPTR